MECPGCKTKDEIDMAIMKPGGSWTCPSCSGTVRFTGDDLSGAGEALDNLKGALARFGAKPSKR